MYLHLEAFFSDESLKRTFDTSDSCCCSWSCHYLSSGKSTSTDNASDLIYSGKTVLIIKG